MTRGRVRRVICAADPRGSGEALGQVLEQAGDLEADALLLLGDLSDGGLDGYRSVFRVLGSAGLPAYWIPGPGDAPVHDYLREAANIEVAFPFLHGVHGTAAFGPGYVLFAGLGGEVSNDPDERTEELDRLRYPRWEPEYRLKLLRELKDYELVLAFWTRPAHKGRGKPGSDAVAELVKTSRARLVVCAGERGEEMLGRCLVVSPGSLQDGHYAVADLHTHRAQFKHLAAAPA